MNEKTMWVTASSHTGTPTFVSYINSGSNTDDVIEVCRAFDNVCICIDDIGFDVTAHICNALMNIVKVCICSAISTDKWLLGYAQKYGDTNLPNVLNIVPESHSAIIEAVRKIQNYIRKGAGYLTSYVPPTFALASHTRFLCVHAIGVLYISCVYSEESNEYKLAFFEDAPNVGTHLVSMSFSGQIDINDVLTCMQRYITDGILEKDAPKSFDYKEVFKDIKRAVSDGRDRCYKFSFDYDAGKLQSITVNGIKYERNTCDEFGFATSIAVQHMV